jgi:hypothetical protein
LAKGAIFGYWLACSSIVTAGADRGGTARTVPRALPRRQRPRRCVALQQRGRRAGDPPTDDRGCRSCGSCISWDKNIRLRVKGQRSRRGAAGGCSSSTGPEGPTAESSAEAFMPFMNFMVKSVRSTARAGRAPYN